MKTCTCAGYTCDRYRFDRYRCGFSFSHLQVYLFVCWHPAFHSHPLLPQLFMFLQLHGHHSCTFSHLEHDMFMILDTSELKGPGTEGNWRGPIKHWRVLMGWATDWGWGPGAMSLSSKLCVQYMSTKRWKIYFTHKAMAWTKPSQSQALVDSFGLARVAKVWFWTNIQMWTSQTECGIWVQFPFPFSR